MMSVVGTSNSGVGDGDPFAVPALMESGDGRGGAPGDGQGVDEVWSGGRVWQVGGAGEIRWIAANTRPGTSIASAIPPVFDKYATLVVPESDEDKTLMDDALVTLLRAHSPEPTWWLGYLETGASDVVFPDARRVWLYSGWPYVLVKAGPDQAGGWRKNDAALPWHSALPELMFPADHSWLVSTLWDDDWACVGGPASLVDACLNHPQIEARLVTPDDEDVAPPGHREH
jgi:hypothetical protein